MKILPEDSAERKKIPVYSGFIKYFPRAIAEVARLSAQGNIQHGIGDGTAPVWDRSKSPDELDAMMRHILDEDWVHVAWRSLANLEKQLEKQVTVEAHDNTDNVTVHGIGSLQGVSPELHTGAWEVLIQNPDFEKFLEQHNAKEKWIHNFDPEYYARAGCYTGLINGAFKWVHTKEGHKFWHNLWVKWKDQCK